jgi:hypothetical protein
MTFFSNKTSDPFQNVQEAALGKGEVCQPQLLYRKEIKKYVKNKKYINRFLLQKHV